MNKIRIGTRGSKLALKQAELVQDALRKADSQIETELVVLRTKGDKIQDKPFSEIGDKGVFASELEQALANGQIDIAVHSAKDLPVTLAEGLTIAAVLPRADVRDVLVLPKRGRIDAGAHRGDGHEENIFTTNLHVCCAGYTRQIHGSAPKGEPRRVSDKSVNEEAREWQRQGKEDRQDMFVIGSGSRRRRFQAMQLWDRVTCENIRGNVDTRLRKLQEGAYDGIILAKAGLDRLGIDSGQAGEFLFLPLPPEQFLPAACQGIIAVEAMRDSDAAKWCGKITDAETEVCFLVEREVLTWLSADCSEAAAAWCRREEGRLLLDVMYAGNRQRLMVSAGNTGNEAGYEIEQKTNSIRKQPAGKANEAAVRDESEHLPDGKKDRYNGELQAGLQMARAAAALVKGKEKL